MKTEVTVTKLSLEEIARALVPPGKGILAADESVRTITKRFAALGIPSTPETRRAYREMLFTTPQLGKFVSGAILFDEQIRQADSSGTPLAAVLTRAGILPGIKVDLGAKPLAACPGETVTEGLDGLRDRFAEYGRMGVRFAKWRAVIHVDERIPSDTCLAVNAHALARYAALAQEAGLVPIVEPEVLMTGAHDLARTEEVTARVLERVFAELRAQRVMLEGMLLKPNMVLPGKDSPERASVAAVATSTLRVLRRSVPVAVPGVVFLSGGQDDRLATEHLDAMNAVTAPLPWRLTFSFARALQDAPLAAWRGDAKNVEQAQRALLHRARCNAAASLGTYDESMERSEARPLRPRRVAAHA